jgi:SSS family solute:Na+ symporter
LQFSLSTLDLVIFFASLAVVMAVGLWASRHERDTRDFFLASGNVKWWQIAGSIFGSNVSSHHLVGMTGVGLAIGFAQANFEFGAIAGLMVLSFLFLPIYRRLKIFTLSQFLEKRFDGRSQAVYSLVSIFTLVAFEMVATLYIGSGSLGVLFGVDYRWGILIVCLVTGAYTISGGLKAVIWTDVIQSVLLIVGASTVAIFALTHPAIGGISGMLEKEPDRFHVFFALNHAELPWLGVMTGLMILHFNYWGINQFIVQRALGARSNWDGRMGIILAGFFKLLIPFITILPGMAAGHLIKDAQLFELPLKPDGTQNADMAFPLMMKHLLPAGFVGLALAGLVGAILSTVDSMMNAAATLFTFDFYKKFYRPQASEKELILVGRIAIAAVLLVSGYISAFLYDPQGNFFLTLTKNTSFFLIGVITAFLIGITWKGATPTAAFTVMLLGPIVSFTVNKGWSLLAERWQWLVDTFAAVNQAGELVRDETGGLEINFFYRIWVAFVICAILLIVISKLTAHQRRPEYAEMVWTGPRDPATVAERAVTPLWRDERIWAAVLIAADIALCIKFA